MPESTLEFIGQRLKAIQDEQHLQRMRYDIIEQRFSTIEARLDGLEQRLAAVFNIIHAIDGKLDRIIDKLGGAT